MSAEFDRRTAGSVQASNGGRTMKQPTVHSTGGQSRTETSRLGPALPLAAALLLLGAGAGRAEPAASGTNGPAATPLQTAAAPATGTQAGPRTGLEVPSQIFVLDAQSLSQERTRNKVVGVTREALTKSGTAPLYAPAATSELALREAAIEALRRNLDIKRGGIARASAERALIEADAVFDPVFAASANAALNYQFRRIEYPNSKFKASTERVPVGATDSKSLFACSAAAAALTQGADQGRACYVITFPNRSVVTTLQYTQNRPEGFYPSTVNANVPSPNAPRNDEVYNGTVSIFQQLPWGPSLNLSLNTKRQQTYYVTDTLNGLGPLYHSYYRPYFTTISVGATLPLPYTKNFGPTASADVQSDIARHNIDAAELDVRGVINSTLLQVDALYWQLVGTVGSMEAANQSLALAEKQRASVKRLFDQGFVTESDRNQIDAQVSRIRTQQQQLFGSYVTASEAMRKLLDGKEDALILPVGYQALMKRPAADIVEPDRILNNPLYQRQAVAVRIASLLRAQAEAQTRPDLTGTATVTMAECCTFGYRDLSGSLTRAFTSRDQLVATFALLYQRPIGNRAAWAALDAADHGLNQQAMALHAVELATREDFETARGALASARERVRIAEGAVKVAQEVHESAAAQQDLGLVAAYETIARLTALLSARTQLVQAQVDLRTAEARLLASVGALAERYGEMTAQTGIDLERLALLRESGALKHFGGPL